MNGRTAAYSFSESTQSAVMGCQALVVSSYLFHNRKQVAGKAHLVSSRLFHCVLKWTSLGKREMMMTECLTDVRSEVDMVTEGSSLHLRLCASVKAVLPRPTVPEEGR